MTTQVEPTIYDKIREDLATIAKLYPPEFVGSIADNARAAAHDWLESNGIPQEVTDLLENSLELDRAENAMIAGDLDEMGACELVTIVATTADLIAKLGGTFVGGGSQTIPRDPLKWEPGESKYPSIFGGQQARTRDENGK